MSRNSTTYALGGLRFRCFPNQRRLSEQTLMARQPGMKKQDELEL
jgi:hypothetical protein